MIILTSLISIGIVYYFHETGMILAFGMAFIMEVLFLFYVFNYLKELDQKHQSVIAFNTSNFEKREEELIEEINELKERLEIIGKQLSTQDLPELTEPEKKTPSKA